MTFRGSMIFVLLVVIVGGAGYTWFRAEGDSPVVAGPDSLVLGRDGHTLTIEVSDVGSGLREVRVVVVTPDREVLAAEHSYPGSLGTGGLAPALAETLQVPIDPDALDLPEGDLMLVTIARDWSWRDGFLGNTTRWEIPLQVDLSDPTIQIASGLTYIARGGSAVVVYQVGEPTLRDGVTVGETFFHGYPAPGSDASSRDRVALFAVPTDAPPDPPIQVIAQDRAGNTGHASWPVVLKERQLPEDDVILPQRFLDTTVRNLAGAAGIAQDDLEEAFDQINVTVRASNESQIREVVRDSAQTPIWNGAFVQMQGSKVTSRFAERRSYYSNSKKISEATHFGYDLASTAGAPITASNSGRVAFADDLGIYGNCVIVDHGLGLFTLYAHLSRMDVAVGDDVEQNASLGLSGATGLAGGDHLHFATIVGGTYVEPLEWWDPLWVQAHVEARLDR